MYDNRINYAKTMYIKETQAEYHIAWLFHHYADQYRPDRNNYDKQQDARLLKKEIDDVRNNNEVENVLVEMDGWLKKHAKHRWHNGYNGITTAQKNNIIKEFIKYVKKNYLLYVR